MQIVKANAGALTNFEVLDFLNSRGASNDTARVIGPNPIAKSEIKVYDYLMETAASTQTREGVNEFAEKCKDFNVAKAEILSMINLRPSNIIIERKEEEDKLKARGIDSNDDDDVSSLPSLMIIEKKPDDEDRETNLETRGIDSDGDDDDDVSSLPSLMIIEKKPDDDKETNLETRGIDSDDIIERKPDDYDRKKNLETRGMDSDGILELVQDLLMPPPTTDQENDQEETEKGEES
ncbi:unnamed protein product [Microthlaspi erraticum]|uniref:DNA-directed RNA polymerase III subunit RPC9 n=1 Tax=Microthlaspi erraticum TaxID=1685480 RepID=A0A6D2J6Z5_9BRAS|nr:unnamed protein product [Microthlaspi erraticum]